MRSPHRNLGELKPLSLLDPTSLPSISFIERQPDSPRPGTLSSLDPFFPIYQVNFPSPVPSGLLRVNEKPRETGRNTRSPSVWTDLWIQGAHLFPRLGSEFAFTRQHFSCRCEERCVCCVCMHHSAAACATVETSKFPLPKQVRATH